MLQESTIIDPRGMWGRLRKFNARRCLKDNGHPRHNANLSVEELKQIIRAEGYDITPYVDMGKRREIEPRQAKQISNELAGVSSEVKRLREEIAELKRNQEDDRYQRIQQGAPKGDETYIPGEIHEPVVYEPTVEDMTRAQLMHKAKEMGIPLNNKLKRTDLIELIQDVENTT